jgi:hypothetical protein
MNLSDRNPSQALFQSTDKDGTRWLFVVGCDSGWAILRNGDQFEISTERTASVSHGVVKFLSLTRVAEDLDVAI